MTTEADTPLLINEAPRWPLPIAWHLARVVDDDSVDNLIAALDGISAFIATLALADWLTLDTGVLERPVVNRMLTRGADASLYHAVIRDRRRVVADRHATHRAHAQHPTLTELDDPALGETLDALAALRQRLQKSQRSALPDQSDINACRHSFWRHLPELEWLKHSWLIGIEGNRAFWLHGHTALDDIVDLRLRGRWPRPTGTVAWLSAGRYLLNLDPWLRVESLDAPNERLLWYLHKIPKPGEGNYRDLATSLTCDMSVALGQSPLTPGQPLKVLVESSMRIPADAQAALSAEPGPNVACPKPTPLPAHSLASSQSTNDEHELFDSPHEAPTGLNNVADPEDALLFELSQATHSPSPERHDTASLQGPKDSRSDASVHAGAKTLPAGAAPQANQPRVDESSPALAPAPLEPSAHEGPSPGELVHRDDAALPVKTQSWLNPKVELFILVVLSGLAVFLVWREFIYEPDLTWLPARPNLMTSEIAGTAKILFEDSAQSNEALLGAVTLGIAVGLESAFEGEDGPQANVARHRSGLLRRLLGSPTIKDNNAWPGASLGKIPEAAKAQLGRGFTFGRHLARCATDDDSDAKAAAWQDAFNAAPFCLVEWRTKAWEEDACREAIPAITTCFFHGLQALVNTKSTPGED